MTEHVLLDCGHVKEWARSAVLCTNSRRMICGPCSFNESRAKYEPKVLRREKLPLKVGHTALVVGGMFMNRQAQERGEDPYPLPGGNCCSILNMVTENVEEALRRWPELKEACEMEVVELRGQERYRVVDERLPPEWKKGKNCLTCNIFEDFDAPPQEPVTEEPPPRPTGPILAD